MTTIDRDTRVQPSWREEMCQDRLISAQIEREREAARTQARIAERQALAQTRREEELARSAARQQARERRAARRADRAAWVRGHVLDLLFVPVIVVPAVLAWTAMGAYGYQLYGPPGLLLPAFSEGAMWAFAFATTLTRRRHPGRPVWHLRLGTAVFAAYGAALNFLHGLTVSVITGVVMALVSVAGVVVHQFITAGPRRSRAERDQARLDRAAARREMAARRAAVRHAVADLDGDGDARLIYEPGMVALTRRRGRTRLAAPAAPETGPGAQQDRPAPEVISDPAQVSTSAERLVSNPGEQTVSTGDHEPLPLTMPASLRSPASRQRTRRPVTGEDAEQEFMSELAEGAVPSLRQIRARMHVNQDNARRLRAHLEAVSGPVGAVQ